MDDLVFNELSINPCCTSFEELNQRIENLLNTCKEARGHFNFKKLRFTQELHEYKLLTNTFSFYDYIKDKRVKPNIKTLLLTIRRYPFIDDEDENIFNQYITNKFHFAHENEKQKCDGLATAYLYQTVAVGFANTVWINNLKAPIIITTEENIEINRHVYHASDITHFQQENELTHWLKQKQQAKIESIDDLKSLYPDYLFESQAFDDLMFWKETNNNYDRLHLLLRDIKINSCVGGLGKTEPLKGDLSGKFSKRLTQEDRIVYSVEQNIVTVFSCKGHYE